MKGAEEMIENGVVTLPVDEYDKLVSRATKYSVLLNGLLRNTDLAYDGKNLIFNHDFIGGMIRALDGHLYSARVMELKQELKRKEAENDD